MCSSNGPHKSRRDNFDHVRYDLHFSDDNSHVYIPIHVRYDWPNNRRASKYYMGVSLLFMILYDIYINLIHRCFALTLAILYDAG